MVLFQRKDVLLLACLVLQQQASGHKDNYNLSCTVCHDRSAVRFPEKVPVDQGILAGQTCQQIDRVIGMLHPNVSSTECQAVQSIGALCGCPPLRNTCSVCAEGSIMTEPGRTLPFLSHLFSGFVPTCEVLQAYFFSTENSTEDEMCMVAQGYMADYCGCARNDTMFTIPSLGETKNEEQPCSLCSNNDDLFSYPNRTLALDGFPFTTCFDLQDVAGTLLTEESAQCGSLKGVGAFCGCPVEDVKEPCTLCPDGSLVSLPHKPFPRLKEHFGGFTPSCAMVENTALQLERDSNTCQALQLVSSMCGCPAVDNHCRYCDEWEDGVPPEYTDEPIPFFADFFGAEHGPDVTCEEAFYSQYQIERSEGRCELGKLGSWYCGCTSGSVSYLHADTDTKKMVLAWIPRVTGTLSVLVSVGALLRHRNLISPANVIAFFSFAKGSLSIILDVLRAKKRQVRNTILFAMSCADLPASVAMALSTLPTPRGWGIYGAMGNMTSCRVQGFFVQLGVMALMYNGALSFYFYLSLARGWSEERVRRIEHWILGVPLVCGLTLAFAAIPYYTSIAVHCHIVVPPAATWYPILFLAIVPNITVTVVSTTLMAIVCVKVRQQAKRMARWRFQPKTKNGSRRRQSPSIDRRIFWQAVLFLLAFYVTHTVHLCLLVREWLRSRHRRYTGRSVYVSWVLFTIVTPLQGFWNAFIYFRRRLSQRAVGIFGYCCSRPSSVADSDTATLERTGSV